MDNLLLEEKIKSLVLSRCQERLYSAQFLFSSLDGEEFFSRFTINLSNNSSPFWFLSDLLTLLCEPQKITKLRIEKILKNDFFGIQKYDLKSVSWGFFVKYCFNYIHNLERQYEQYISLNKRIWIPLEKDSIVTWEQLITFLSKFNCDKYRNTIEELASNYSFEKQLADANDIIEFLYLLRNQIRLLIKQCSKNEFDFTNKLKLNSLISEWTDHFRF